MSTGTQEEAVERVRWRKYAIYAALILLVAVGFLVRALGGGSVVQDERLVLRDPDTLRRLVRLEHISDPAVAYPGSNPDDGYPEGSTIHWTLPMDGMILALDGALGDLYPQARRFEAGAMWAGPLLGALALAALGWLAMRWLGPGRGLACAFLYFATLSAIASSVLGLGDHQSLQLLCVAVALPAFLALVAGRAGTGSAALVGLAVGLGLWTSAELTVLFQLLALATFLALLLSRAGEREWRLHLTWSLVCLGVCLVAVKIENPSRWWVFEWDRISHFQAWQVAVLVLFLVLLRPLSRRTDRTPWRATALAGLSALVLGGLPFLLPPLRAALGEQLRLAGAANHWVQTAVNEFRPLFSHRGQLFLGQAHDLLGPALYTLPLALVGVVLQRQVPGAARAALLVLVLGFFGLGCWEVKLLPLLGIALPFALVLGGGWWVDLLRRTALSRAAISWIGGALVVGYGALALVPYLSLAGAGDGESSPPTPGEEVAAWLRERLAEEGGEGSVLAPWDMGATLMYHSGAAVVASNYHRNMAGILDGYRFLVASSWAEAEEILRRRRVRWIVLSARQHMLLQADEVLAAHPRHLVVSRVNLQRNAAGGFSVADELRVLPTAPRTMFWRLNYYLGPQPDAELASHLRLEFRSSTAVPVLGPGGKPAEIPLLRVYRVLTSP